MATQLWFTADTHFGHTNIIRYCQRPFDDVEHMDESLIANWNAVVKPGDLVWHLGDFSFAEPSRYLTRLNGTIHLCFGNHDSRWRSLLTHSSLASTCDVRWLRWQKQRIFLSHYAHREWPKAHHGSWHLFGHSHGDLPDHGRSTDVGVDCWNYRPVNFDEIHERLTARELVPHHA